MKEFKVNEYIILKLEGGVTNIYVMGELFQQCKFLLLNIPVDKISTFDEIDSIDEAAEKLDRSLEGNSSEINIPPETEFWGHCSNLQVWAEMYYDTRLLHSNLAFPLLKKLTGVGDTMARRVFTEEIAKRFQNGSPHLITYLVNENYLDFLNKEERTELVKEKYVNFLNGIGELDSKANYKVFYELIKSPEFIEINFTDFLRSCNRLDDTEKNLVFLRLITTIRGTELMSENFSEILNWIVNLKPERMYNALLSLITNIRGTEQMGENFSDILNIFDKINSFNSNILIFSEFIKKIEIHVLKENFVEILDRLDGLNSNEQNDTFFVLINLLEGTELLEEKFLLIKEKFPKLSNSVLTDSRILETLRYDECQSIEQLIIKLKIEDIGNVYWKFHLILNELERKKKISVDIQGGMKVWKLTHTKKQEKEFINKKTTNKKFICPNCKNPTSFENKYCVICGFRTNHQKI